MKSKELFGDLWSRIVLRHNSGEGYWNIIVTSSPVWRKSGTAGGDRIMLWKCCAVAGTVRLVQSVLDLSLGHCPAHHNPEHMARTTLWMFCNGQARVQSWSDWSDISHPTRWRLRRTAKNGLKCLNIGELILCIILKRLEAIIAANGGPTKY